MSLMAAQLTPGMTDLCGYPVEDEIFIDYDNAREHRYTFLNKVVKLLSECNNVRVRSLLPNSFSFFFF